MLRRHSKLFILILIELVVIIGMTAGSFGVPASMTFVSSDFADNVRGRDNIYVDDAGAHFNYDESLVIYDDEGRIIGDDLLTGKFAIGSGAYDVSVSYEAEALNGYAELYSESGITEPVSAKIMLVPDKTNVSSKIYIPFGRSLHDLQLNIHYTGPESLVVYGIDIVENTSYRWVPITGYLLLFILLDVVLWFLFAKSGHRAREYIREHYELPVLLIIIALSSLPSFADFLYEGHDLHFHLARIIAVSHEIYYGQFPVRMLTDMLRGYSYPTSTFYCDLFMYPFALIYMLGVPLRVCWQMYVIAVNTFTAAVSYFCFRKISDSRDIGLIGTALYALSAYRIVDIYLRSAMGEFTAMAFIPFVALGIWSIYYDDESEESRRGWIYLGLGMTSIALCHLLSLEMISLFLIIFCLLEYKRTFTKAVISSILKAALITVLLSCWFIFPMLLSMHEIGLSMYEHQTYIQAEGAYPVQVFNMFMRGKGYSTTATPMEMPLSLGGGMVISLAMLLYVIMRRDFGDRCRQRNAFLMVVISILFSMYFFPWDSIASITENRLPEVSRLARMVQYPWRFMEITTVLLSVCTVCILRRMDRKLISFKCWTFLLLLGTVISLGAFYDPFINEAEWTRASDEYYMDASIGREEYLPEDSGRLADLTYEVMASDDIDVLAYDASDGERTLKIANKGEADDVLIPLFSYPGYHAEDIKTHEEMAIGFGDNARIMINIPAGYSGMVRVYYKEPFTWRIFEIISLVSAVFLIIGMVRGFTKKSGRQI